MAAVRRRLPLGLLLLTAACVSPRAGVPVVLISIDGLKPEYITDADQHGL